MGLSAAPTQIHSRFQGDELSTNGNTKPGTRNSKLKVMETQAALPRSSTNLLNKRERNHLFSIKPYKNNLLTPGANYWIICIHLVILVMASSEAIAWGYLGSLFGKEAIGVIAAIITFAFMFLIIWVIDVSFVTLDLSRSYYDKIILKKETERWVDNTRLGVGLLGRITIVFVSLSISAPFLAQIVFKQDIDNEIDRRNMATVSMVSDSMLIAKDEEIASLDSMILVREAELVQETAGKGESGNYGYGPVTRAIQSNIDRLRDERTEVLAEKAAFDQTVQSLTVPEFADLYNVDLIDNGVRTREEILSGLMENPEYRTAKTAITAFLAFIFAALVLLKLFQPRSVRIYYNEKLQDLYKEYLAGHLNKWIAVPEQSVNGESNMSPLRFEDWCVNTYSVVRNEDIKRRDSRKIYNLFKMKIEQLEEEKAEIKKLMEPIEVDFEEAMAEVNEIKIELLDAENKLQQNARDGEEIRQQLDRISDDLRHNRFSGSDILIAVTAKKEAEDKLSANNHEHLSLQYKHDLVRHRFDVKDADAKQIEELIAKIRQNYRNIQEKIDRERLAYTDLIVNGDVIDIPTRGGASVNLIVEDREIELTQPKEPAIAALESPVVEEEENPVDNLLSERTQVKTLNDTFAEPADENVSSENGLSEKLAVDYPGADNTVEEYANDGYLSEEIPAEEETLAEEETGEDKPEHVNGHAPVAASMFPFSWGDGERSLNEEEQNDESLTDLPLDAPAQPDLFQESEIEEDADMNDDLSEEAYYPLYEDSWDDPSDSENETEENLEEASWEGDEDLKNQEELDWETADYEEETREPITLFVNNQTDDGSASVTEAPTSEEKQEEAPVEFVDDKKLNAYAEAVSLANYTEAQAKEDSESSEDDEVSDEKAVEIDKDEELAPAEQNGADYFVDPALIVYSDYDAEEEESLAASGNALEEEAIPPEGLPVVYVEDLNEPEAGSSFNKDFRAFLNETEEADEEEPEALLTADDLAELPELTSDDEEVLTEAEAFESTLPESNIADDDNTMLDQDTDVSDDETEVRDVREDSEPGPEKEDDAHHLEESILKQLGARTDRKGRPIRKGTFGKTFGEGV